MKILIKGSKKTDEYTIQLFGEVKSKSKKYSVIGEIAMVSVAIELRKKYECEYIELVDTETGKKNQVMVGFEIKNNEMLIHILKKKKPLV